MKSLICALALLCSVSNARAQDWELIGERTQNERHAQVKATAWGRTVTQLGRPMLEFKVHVETKAIGRSTNARGYANFGYVTQDGGTILMKQVTKYSSTSLAQNDHTEHEEQIFTVGADAFWTKFDAGLAELVFTVQPTAKVDFPTSTVDAAEWIKSNVSGPAADGLRDLRNRAVGTVLEGDGWMVKKIARGTFK